MADSTILSKTISMDTGGLPLFSTLALLTIVAGQLQGSGYKDQEPEFLSLLENVTVAQGRDVHFTCTVNRLGNHKVAWIKSDTKTILAIHTQMVTLNSRLSVSHNGHNTWKLYINNVEPGDSGTYMCQINTDPMMSQMGYLSVVIPPDIADDDGSEASATEGGSVELRCTATGEPPPTISWKRNAGKSIVLRDDNGKKYKEVHTHAGSILSLKSLQRADMGTYLCIAANGIPPTKSRRYEVVVLFKPIVRVVTPVVLRSIHMQVTLLCDVEASPRSLNTWHRNKPTGSKLLNDSKYTFITEDIRTEYFSRMNLTMTRLRKEDFGEYTCSSVNGYGKAEGSVMLKETPLKTTTTTTSTTTTTTTTTRPTTRATTRTVKKQPKKQHTTLHNVIETDMRQAELNNAINYFSNNVHGTNTTHNEYAQRMEKQKVRPSGPPRHYIAHSSVNPLSCSFISLWLLFFVVKIIKCIV